MKSIIMEGKQCTTGSRQNVSRYFTVSDALIAFTEFIFDDKLIQRLSLVAEGVLKLTVSFKMSLLEDLKSWNDGLKSQTEINTFLG